MVTNFTFDSSNSFSINGTIDFKGINLEIQKVEDINEIYKEAISKMVNIKKTIIKCLANDEKIIGNERIELIKAIDHFLTLLIAMALLYSNTPLLFTNEIEDFFSITIQATKTKVFKVIGNIYNISPKDLTNYTEWVENNIFNLFKEIITISNNLEKKETLLNKITKLIFNIIYLRYKIEYI
ncbi:MAG TPA: hypothetical protein PLE45_10140 [Spirochaetota bacterium]|nr:hypothetical protein [Spirochaetota bacterium]HOL57454.1 hypothetical protein [Spirochaetota bacterium]HPP03620.1 hypothetical protein [Spirochaetota bacterium]